MRPDIRKHTVAWVCALSVELAAARTLFDEVHAPLETISWSDPNTHLLGRVHCQNVVVACLPSGRYGVASAAIILAHMKSTFPSLQFGLMVGDGGGVPSLADVRLGDVVGGVPTPSSPGVIRYSYGKTLPGGRLQCTGSLNKPTIMSSDCCVTDISPNRKVSPERGTIQAGKRLIRQGPRAMGSTHQDLGEYHPAEALHRRALEGRKAIFGLEHAETLRSLSKLGSVVVLQGKYHESETMHRQALDGTVKVLGLDHPSTLTSLGKVGSALSFPGKYQDAEGLFRQTLAGRKRMLGVYHPNTLASISQLGYVRETQGKYAEAEDLHRQCLLASEKILGPEHPHTLHSMSQLGSVLESQGRYVEAESIHRRILHGREKLMGPDHPDTLVSVRPLASVLESQRKYTESEQMYRQALARAQTILGPEQPETLSIMSQLGLVLSRQGRSAAAK